MALLDILAVAFIVLKLTGIISWKWVWVLSPIWGQVMIVVFSVLCEVFNERNH